VPQDERAKKQAQKDQEDFVHTFQSERECFGITLILADPKSTDFSLQLFNGIDERTGRLQWVVYRMDTLELKATGETTGSIGDVAKSVCSSIHDAVSDRGGRVEGK
jgi:hypothetical protein